VFSVFNNNSIIIQRNNSFDNNLAKDFGGKQILKKAVLIIYVGVIYINSFNNLIINLNNVLNIIRQ